MQYLGGKYRLSNKIVEFLESKRIGNQPFFDPFMGSGIITAKMSGVRYASDIHPELIALHRAIQKGWIPPENVSEAEYKSAKAGNGPAYLRGFIGFCCSFSGRWFEGYARNARKDNFASNGSNSLVKQGRSYASNGSNSLVKQGRSYASNGSKVIIFNGDYCSVMPHNSLIYCDPPYPNTKFYSKTPKFDYDRFYQTIDLWLSRGNQVFISGYDTSAYPDHWIKALSLNHAKNIKNGKGIQEKTIEVIYRAMPQKAKQVSAQQTSFLELDPVVYFDGQFLQDLPDIPLDLPVLAFDVETQTKYDGVGPKKGFGLSYVADVTVISLAWDDHKLSTSENFDKLLPAITSCKTLVAHNAVFDMRQLSKWGISHDQIWDTLTMARLLRPELDRYERLKGKTRKGYSLLECLDLWEIPYPEYLTAQKKTRGKLHKQSNEQVLTYAADDAYLTLQLYHAQIEDCYRNNLASAELIEWEVKAVTEYCRMAGQGLGVNLEWAHNKIKSLQAICDEKGKQFSFNPRSAADRVCFIYGVQPLPKKDQENEEKQTNHAKKIEGWRGKSLCLRKPVYEPYSVYFTKQFGLSTSGDALHSIAKSGDWELDSEVKQQILDLADFVTCDTMIGTIQGYLNHAALDNQIHSTINIATITGRRNSSNPNLQNPKMAGDPSDIEGNLCGLFKPLDPDYTYVELDYNNAENRMQGMLAGDSVMIKACNTGDFHANMAVIYFGDEFTSLEPHSDMWNHFRFMSKSVTFGNAYEMGEEKLANKLGISRGKAHGIQSTAKANFYKITKAKEIAKSRIARDGYISLWTGRKVPVDKNKSYKAWNAVSQGGVGEMLKRAIVVIGGTFRENNMRSYVAHDIHDALLLAVYRPEWDQAIKIASEIMQSIIPAELNNRTDPPCIWVAQPDLKKNAKKWGYGQYHPKLPKDKKSKRKKQPEKPMKKVFEYSMPELGFKGYANLVVSEIELTLEAAHNSIDQARNNQYKIYLWKDDGSVNPQDYRDVNLSDAVTILTIWENIRIAKVWTEDQLNKALGLDVQAILALPAKLDEYETQVITMIGAIAKNGKA